MKMTKVLISSVWIILFFCPVLFAQDTGNRELSYLEFQKMFTRLRIIDSGGIPSDVPVSFLEVREGAAIFVAQGKRFVVSPFPLDGIVFQGHNLRLSYGSAEGSEGTMTSIFFTENENVFMEVVGNSANGGIWLEGFKISKGIVTNRPWGRGNHRHTGAIISGHNGYRKEIVIGEMVELSANDGTWCFLLVDGRVNLPKDEPIVGPNQRASFVQEEFKEIVWFDYILYRK